mgnify:CR=1 FL=1
MRSLKSLIMSGRDVPDIVTTDNTNLCTLFYGSAITIGGKPSLEDEVTALAEHYAEGYLASCRKGLGTFSPDASSAWGGLWDYLLEPLLSHNGTCLHKAPAGAGAEEVAAGLIRSGVSRDDIRATYQHVTVTLPNGTFRLYRGLKPGTPAGSLRILLPGMSQVFETGLASAELSRLILFIDSIIPALKRVMDRLAQDIKMAEKEYIAGQKAEEIARKAVSTLLGEVLPGLDIGYSFRLVGGKVRLDLRKEFHGRVDIPLDKIVEFLSEPEKILSTLSPVKVQEPEWAPDSSPLRSLPGWPGKRLK